MPAAGNVILIAPPDGLILESLPPVPLSFAEVQYGVAPAPPCRPRLRG
jgi:hypothetical protein